MRVKGNNATSGLVVMAALSSGVLLGAVGLAHADCDFDVRRFSLLNHRVELVAGMGDPDAERSEWHPVQIELPEAGGSFIVIDGRRYVFEESE